MNYHSLIIMLNALFSLMLIDVKNQPNQTQLEAFHGTGVSVYIQEVIIKKITDSYVFNIYIQNNTSKMVCIPTYYFPRGDDYLMPFSFSISGEGSKKKLNENLFYSYGTDEFVILGKNKVKFFQISIPYSEYSEDMSFSYFAHGIPCSVLADAELVGPDILQSISDGAEFKIPKSSIIEYRIKN